MFESMYAAQGIGLAAPQIGIAKRLTVIDLSNQKEPKDKIVLINPEITLREGKQLEEEGCLSLPEIREKVRRSARVIVKAQERSCCRVPSSTRSIIWMEFCSSFASARSSAI